MRSAPNELDRLMGERSRHFQEYEKILAQRDDELDRLYQGLGPGSARWKILLDNKSGARAEFEAIAGQLGRPVNRLELPAGAFYALAVMLAIVETPVNKFLFDVALQGSNLTSYLVSFAVAGFILIAAHLAGRLTRQCWSEFKTKFYVSNIVIVAVIMTILLGVVGILTIGRAEFSAAALASGIELFSSVGQKVQVQGVIRALAAALSDTSALVLATVNVTSILAAFLLGYFSHDSDKHLDKAFEKHKSADRALERRDRQLKARSEKARERARVRLGDINTRYTAANAAIVTQKAARGLVVDQEDKFALPRLDRLLDKVRAKAEFAGSDGNGSDEGDAGSGDQRPPPLEAVQAHSNVTRVPLRDQK
jgi:hypothetical protein